MFDFTIMEYDYENGVYTTIGFAEGVDSKEAKKNYIKKHNWQEKEGIILFAKPPLCR